MKIGQKTQHIKLFKTFSCHTTYAHVQFKGQFSKNVSYFLNSKVDKYVFLYYQDSFGHTLACLCPEVNASSTN
jgi:hypothetical protein